MPWSSPVTNRSRSVGLTQCFITVESDQDSFRLGGRFCTEVLRSEALLRSESYENDLKSPKRPKFFFRIVYDVITIVHLKR